MHTIYISGQMRSGTTLVSSFLAQNKGVKILVDQARILTASGQAFKGKDVDFSMPLNLFNKMKLFEAFINVTLWPSKNWGDGRMAFATKRIEPFLGYIQQIRNSGDRLHISTQDILDLPNFRTHLDFFDVVLEQYVPIVNKRTLSYVGNKETRGEKFAAAMGAAGKKAIVVVRDPRAVISSLMEKIQSDPNFGVKDSADEAIQRWLNGYEICKRNPRIHIVRYEDFIQEHDKTVADLSDYLGVQLVSGSGIMTNNSSFSDVEKGTLSEAGISRWREYSNRSLIGEVTEKCRTGIEDLGYDI